MSFLLKIVEGPNKGAEIALVDGVAVTLGKGDDCDIVLADPTMPDAPVSIEASAGGVAADGEALAPFAVKTLGATSFAIGPADGRWGELQWPETGTENRTDDGKKDGEPGGERPKDEKPEEKSPKAETGKAPENPERPGKGNRRVFAAAAAILAIVIALALILRGAFAGSSGDSGAADGPVPGEDAPSEFDILVERHGLAVEDGKVTGNFATRRERLAATAGLYAARPGVELDLSDDESLKTAAEDTLALLSESGLRVAAATNRVVALAGSASSIRRVLEAFASDIPKLRGVDVSGVSAAPGSVADEESPDGTAAADGARPARTVARSGGSPDRQSLPVCGILTAPYPCLVLRNGARILEGAPLGDGVVLKIDADSVTVTNSAGVFTWRP